jgi:hypothetical protein
MTGQELIDYIRCNGLEDWECVIIVHGVVYPVADAWATCGDEKLIRIRRMKKNSKTEPGRLPRLFFPERY